MVDCNKSIIGEQSSLSRVHSRVLYVSPWLGMYGHYDDMIIGLDYLIGLDDLAGRSSQELDITIVAMW